MRMTGVVSLLVPRAAEASPKWVLYREEEEKSSGYKTRSGSQSCPQQDHHHCLPSADGSSHELILYICRGCSFQMIGLYWLTFHDTLLVCFFCSSSSLRFHEKRYRNLINYYYVAGVCRRQILRCEKCGGGHTQNNVQFQLKKRSVSIVWVVMLLGSRNVLCQ